MMGSGRRGLREPWWLISFLFLVYSFYFYSLCQIQVMEDLHLKS